MPGWSRALSVLACAVVVAGHAAAAEPAARKSSFGKFTAPTAEAARRQAHDWLKSTGKPDARFAGIWADDRPLLDRVARTLALGDREAARLLARAGDADAPAPTQMPAVLKDAKKSAFYRHNLGLAYAKALVLRQVYEDALEVLVVVEPEQVVDPAAYFFFRAVCEHGLLLRDAAEKSIDRLLVDVPDSPESYRTVAALMHFDMETWQEKDLAWLARMMDGVQRRLALGRGGKITRRMQREVLARLEEMIKEREHPPSPPGGPGAPPSGPATPPGDTPRPTAPPSTGDVDQDMRRTAEWIVKLPEKDRAAARVELLRKLPSRDRAVIQRYFEELARRSRK